MPDEVKTQKKNLRDEHPDLPAEEAFWTTMKRLVRMGRRVEIWKNKKTGKHLGVERKLHHEEHFE